jgi:hypothetical protein
MTRLMVGDPVWVGPEGHAIPGHILSIHPATAGRVEYVIRTLDLGGQPGENLNLRIRISRPDLLVRPRRPMPISEQVAPAVTMELGHAQG